MKNASDAVPSRDRVMGDAESNIGATALAAIAILASLDLLADLRDGVTAWHGLAEASAAAVACFGALRLLRGARALRRRLDRQHRDFSHFRQQVEGWRAESRNYAEGLSRAIAKQLDQWQLSDAEKEVTFLLLKGLSLKDIAGVRCTTEKTARVQSSAVYAKSGLGGRSELSAFFLEDLLPPTTARSADKH